MKHYTTIEQSKKLLELGLNPESADMQWFLEEDYGIVQIKEGLQDWGGDCTIPCWSLGALLEVMPKEITDKDEIDYKLLLDVKDGFPKYYSTSYEVYHEDFPYPIRDEGKTLFEYLVEGVIWLLENGFIKREPKTSSE